MEFITEEVKTELGLTDDQIKGLEPKFNDYIGNQKGEWDKKANENAEKIISGAAKYAQEKFGVTIEREQGEKYGDYLNRISEKANESSKAEVTRLKSEYDQKLKDFKGGDALQSELQEAKRKLDEAQQRYADYDDLKAKADQFEPLQQQFGTMKEQVAFGGVKPTFSDTVNPYEAKAKWEAFVSGVKAKWNVEIVDGEAVAIDKENPHKTAKLSDLVKADADLSALSTGRQQQGTGARPSKKFEGLDYELPENPDSEAITKAIDEKLSKQGISKTSDEYAKKFREEFLKVKEAVSK